MKRKLCLSAVAALCLTNLYAEGNSSVYELGRIEVVGEQDISQNRAIDVVDEEKIKDTEAKTVVDALQGIPGIFTTYSGGRGEKNIRIRGFGSTRVPIYIDGIPVYVPYDRNMDLQRFTAYDVGEITVSKGYTSPMFGANTMGGAVNIITKKPTSKFEGAIGGGVMNGDGHEEFANIGTNQDLFYAMLSASNYQRDYYKLSENYEPAGWQEGHKRANSAQKDKKLNIKLGLTPNDTDEYSFNYIMQRGDKEQPWYAQAGSGGQYNRNWYWPDWDKTSYYLITKTAIGEHSIKTRFYYDEFYNKMISTPNPANNTATEISIYDDNSYGGAIEGDVQIADNQLLKLSASQKYDNHKDKYDIPSNWVPAKAEDETLSLGAEYAWKINDIFTWLVSGSYDRNHVKKAEFRNSGRTAIQGEYPKYSSDAFNPQTILYAQINKDLMLYGSLSRKSNMPSLKDRYSSRFGSYITNPDLEAERSTNYEVGAQWAISGEHYLKAAAFFTKIDDYLATASGLPGDGIGCLSNCNQIQNAEEQEQKGLELSLDSYWSDKLSGTLSYAYIDAKITKSGDSTAKYVTDVPKHSFYASFKYSPIESVDIIPVIRYESDRYTAINGISKSASYALTDIKAAYRPIKDLEVAVGVKNLFDENYYYDKAYPQEGRSYYANVRYNF